VRPAADLVRVVRALGDASDRQARDVEPRRDLVETIDRLEPSVPRERMERQVVGTSIERPIGEPVLDRDRPQPSQPVLDGGSDGRTLRRRRVRSRTR
jgi:hypothetical protein